LIAERESNTPPRTQGTRGKRCHAPSVYRTAGKIGIVSWIDGNKAKTFGTIGRDLGRQFPRPREQKGGRAVSSQTLRKLQRISGKGKKGLEGKETAARTNI